MKLLFAFITGSFIFLSAAAQKIYLPAIAENRQSLHEAMKQVARQMIPLCKKDDAASYWDNLVRYSLVAEDYKGCIRALDSLIKIYETDSWDGNPALGIQFRTYALVKQEAYTNFSKTYSDTLAALYHRLPEKALPFVGEFFGADTISLFENIHTQLNKLKNADSISMDAAWALLRPYSSWNVLRQAQPLALAFLAAEDDKKYIIEDSVLLPGSNGARLPAIIVRNRKINVPVPAIIMYNIYAGAADKSAAKSAAEKGYAGIVINTRGKLNSPGITEPFEHDGADIYNALDWISKQPWCNGKAGMYGGSYLGFSQWSAAKKLHPLIKTIVPQVAVGAGIDYPMHNGVFMSYMLQWIHFVTNNKTIDLPEFLNQPKWDSLFVQWYRSGKSFRSLDTLDERPNAIFQRWLQHPQYDGYWQNMIPFEKEFARINIPVLTTTGYFDDDQRGAFYYFLQHHRWNKNASHYLLIGPYNHAGAQSAAIPLVSGYSIDSVANINITDIVFSWFDYILKDSAKPALLKNRINYQVMGANEWRHAGSLQAVNNDSMRFYLSNTGNGAYSLVSKQPAAKNYISQQVNLLKRDDADMREQQYLDTIISKQNKLTFISAPLQKDMVMTGSISGNLSFIINKKDADILIELYELRPDGKYFLLSNSLQRCSFIQNPQRRTLLQPGKETSIPVYNAFFTSKKISKGSRLVLLAGINKSPRWQINYGTGKDVSTETAADGKQPLLLQWSNRSFISIPISR